MPNLSDEVKICQFCGQARKPITLERKGKKYVVAYKPCDCKEAQDTLKQQEEQEKEEKEEEIKLFHTTQLKKAKIPKKYWSAEADVSAYLELLLDHKGLGLYFYGDVGTGKTYTACALAKKLIAGDFGVKFYDVPTIVREIRDARAGFHSEQDVVDKLINVDFLIIDDLGVETLSDNNTEILRTIISSREANEVPIIYTSNLSRTEFAKRLSDSDKKIMARRLLSRISGSTEVFKFRGLDRRLNHGK